MIMTLKPNEKTQPYYLITTLNIKKRFTMKTKLYLIDTNYHIISEFKTQNENTSRDKKLYNKTVT